MEKFADFLVNVRDKMVKNGVNVEEFRLFVIAIFPPGDCIPQLPTTVTKVFEAITRHGLWDSIHYSALVQVARKFCAGDPEIEAWIQDYMKDLKAYTIIASIEDFEEVREREVKVSSMFSTLSNSARFWSKVVLMGDLSLHMQ